MPRRYAIIVLSDLLTTILRLLSFAFRGGVILMSLTRESAYARSVSLSILGQRIRAARKGLGMTQQELAAPLFGKAYVSAIERGAVRPSLKALEFLAERLG